jgi:hypothetical protein
MLWLEAIRRIIWDGRSKNLPVLIRQLSSAALTEIEDQLSSIPALSPL